MSELHPQPLEGEALFPDHRPTRHHSTPPPPAASRTPNAVLEKTSWPLQGRAARPTSLSDPASLPHNAHDVSSRSGASIFARTSNKELKLTSAPGAGPTNGPAQTPSAVLGRVKG